MRVQIIKYGTLSILSQEPLLDRWDNYRRKQELGVDGASNVILVDAGERKLLVDTGYGYEGDLSAENVERNRLVLEYHLALHGLQFEDITDLFLTHAHWDHIGNLPHFPRARVCAWERLAEFGFFPRLQGMRLEGVPEGEEILPGVKVLGTPGHTLNHGSLIVDEDIAIAGDAIVDYSYYRDFSVWNFNADFYGLDAARESIRKLATPGRLIIPGHGLPFFVDRAAGE